MENKYLIKVSSQLEKIALNALVKRILASPGKFDEAALTRLSQPMKPDLLALKPTGSPRGLVGPMPAAPRALRTPETYHEGVIDAPKRAFDRHIQNLNNKFGHDAVKVNDHHGTGIPIKHQLAAISGGGYATTGNTIGGQVVGSLNIHAIDADSKVGRLINPVHSVFDNKDKTRLVRGLMLRHEGHEADEILNAPVGADLNQGRISKNGILQGSHASLAVLGKEQKDVHSFLGPNATAKVPYPEVKSKLEQSTNSINKRLTKIRGGTGEAAILHQATGTTYGQDTMPNKYMDQLRNKPFNSIGRPLFQKNARPVPTHSA